MTIAIQISSSNTPYDKLNNFNLQCFSALAKLLPEIQFYFITDHEFIKPAASSANIKYLAVRPSSEKSLLRYYWYNLRLPKILKKYDVHYFFGDEVYCARSRHISQIIRINSVEDFKKSSRIRLSKIRLLKKQSLHAQYIFVPNDYVKESLSASTTVHADKIITLAPGFPSACKPFSSEEKADIKKQYAQDAEYFLFHACNTTMGDIKKCLKGFSIFKKWNKSSMKLLIVLEPKQTGSFQSMLLNYKYKDDVEVVLYNSREKLDSLTAAAYAVIDFPESLQYTQLTINCFHLGIPVILPDHSYYRSGFGDACLYTDGSEKSFSEKMIWLYKDETLRNEFIRKGSVWAEQNSLEKCVFRVSGLIKASTEEQTR